MAVPRPSSAMTMNDPGTGGNGSARVCHNSAMTSATRLGSFAAIEM
jgi:hypothetical protein